MSTMPVSRVKNMIGRALRGVVDLEPTGKQVTALWEFFLAQCAYCGEQLQKGNKSAHIDHLVPISQRGTNHISNRVLSCARCNEVEKKDRMWEAFLSEKCPDIELFERRKQKILEWQRNNGGPSTLPEETAQRLQKAIKAVHDVLDQEVNRLKDLKN